MEEIKLRKIIENIKCLGFDYGVTRVYKLPVRVVFLDLSFCIEIRKEEEQTILLQIEKKKGESYDLAIVFFKKEHLIEETHDAYWRPITMENGESYFLTRWYVRVFIRKTIEQAS